MAVYLPQTLESLVRLGANIVIEDASYLPQTLIVLAQLARASGSHLTISGSYLPQTLEQIARIGGNQITLIVKRN
jgi:hypothetical protein